jgi:hypothetical protein
MYSVIPTSTFKRINSNIFSDLFMNKILSFFLFIIFTFPRALSELKIILLFFLISLTIIYKKNRKIKISVTNFLFYFILFLVPLLVGIINANDLNLILQSFKLAFFFPVLIYLSLISFNNDNLFQILEQTVYWSLIISFIINISTFLFFIGYFPINLNAIFYPGEDIIGINSGYVHIINSSFSYWIFTIPIYFCIKKDQTRFDFILLFLLFILAFLSGRRILLLPFIFVSYFMLNKIKNFLILILFLFVLIKSNVLNSYIDLDTVIQRFIDAIYSTGDSEVRGDQRTYFIKYISESPYFGYGLGAFMPDFLRNETFKTAYENTYDYLIFERGIFFGFLTLLYFVWLLLKVYKNKLINEGVNPIFFASICLLIASFTNPYWLSSFDYALPLALLMKFAYKSAYT